MGATFAAVIGVLDGEGAAVAGATTVAGGGVAAGGTVSAVLIAPDIVLFSAHLLVDETGAFKPDAFTNLQTFFYQDSGNTNLWMPSVGGNVRYWNLDPASVVVNSNYYSDGGYGGASDLAVAKIIPGSLKTNGWRGADTVLPAATPIRLLDRQLELGDSITVLGAGGTGPGSTGYDPATWQAGHAWRGATNIIESTTGGDRMVASFDFDAPAAYRTVETFNLGSPEPTSLEGGIYRGDSGGAWLVQTEYGWALGGTTWGSGGGPGNYGSLAMGTDAFRNAAWLQSFGATVVPEPSTGLLLLMGVVLWAGMRRMRRRSPLTSVGSLLVLPAVLSLTSCSLDPGPAVPSGFVPSGVYQYHTKVSPDAWTLYQVGYSSDWNEYPTVFEDSVLDLASNGTAKLDTTVAVVERPDEPDSRASFFTKRYPNEERYKVPRRSILYQGSFTADGKWRRVGNRLVVDFSEYCDVKDVSLKTGNRRQLVFEVEANGDIRQVSPQGMFGIGPKMNAQRFIRKIQ